MQLRNAENKFTNGCCKNSTACCSSICNIFVEETSISPEISQAAISNRQYLNEFLQTI